MRFHSIFKSFEFKKYIYTKIFTSFCFPYIGKIDNYEKKKEVNI